MNKYLLGLLFVLLVTASGDAQIQVPQPTIPLHVICDSGCGSPPASADKSAFTAGVTNVSLIAGAFNDAMADLTSGTYAAPRLTKQRAMHVNLRDASGVDLSVPFFTPLPTSGLALGAKYPDGSLTYVTTNGLGEVAVALTSLPAITFSYPTGVTATLSNVTADVASVMLLDARASRIGFVFYNDSTSLVYVKFGTTASTTSFTKLLLPRESWATANVGANWVGRIDAIWVSADGTMRVTEITTDT